MKSIDYSPKKNVGKFFKWIKIVSDNFLGAFYYYRGKKLIESGEKENAYLQFNKGVNYFPYNYFINLKLAFVEYKKNNLKQSIKHWEIVYLLNKKPDPYIFLSYSATLKENKQSKKSEEILAEGHKSFPNNKQIICRLAEIALANKNWEKVVKYLECYFNLQSNTPSYNKYITLADGYKELGLLKKAESILLEALDKFPNKLLEIQQILIDISIENKDWQLAIQRIQESNNLNNNFEYQIKLSMLYQLVGKYDESQSVFDNILLSFDKKIVQDSKGYRKMLVYDNGESRIELYKKLEKTESVMITFDSINMEWTESPFAFKLLKKQNLDIVAVRKKKKKTYQQDLNQTDFLKVVGPMIKGYKDRMAYGFSLGAYNALYFSSLLNCRILAYSPRLSIHPQFGRTKIIPKFEMKHNLSHPYNDKISPIIVYDPQNKLDNNYIQNSVIESFPNAKIVKIPYGGHGIAPHLLKMGVLKEFVITFINGGLPHYDRKLKVKSNIYYRNLGENCFKHNKLKWALNLAQTSLEMVPSDKNAIKLKLKVLKRLNRYEEALKFALNSKELLPNNLDIRLYIIDLYILIEELEKAKKEINTSIKKFGKRKTILKRRKMLNNKSR